MIENNKKFYFDNKDLSFKEIKGHDSWFSYFLKYFVGSSLIASLMIVIFISNFDSPEEKKLKREISNLHIQYKSLQQQLENAEKVLDNIQNRDDNIYRMIFGVDPIDNTIRRSGFGGANRYEQHKGFSNSKLIIETQKNVDRLKKQLFIQSKSFDEIINLANNKADMLASIPAIQPISNENLKRMASGYGTRIDPIYKTKKFHHGMDFSAPVGTHIYATGDGKVEKIKKTGSKKDYGNFILIDHGYDYQSFYAHLDKVLVKKGQKVKRGDLIGHVGNTGKSTAPHLHYEVRYKKQKINPVNFYHNDLSPVEYEQMLNIASQENQSFD